MENLDYLIEHENESSFLDFKRNAYHKENYSNLIKDIMSMANAPTDRPKYIICGVKDDPNKSKDIIGVSEIKDQSDIENLIHSNVEPTINFDYFRYQYKEIKLAIFKIFGNRDQPYMMKKKYRNMPIGDMYVRIGAKNEKVTREYLDKMMEFRSKQSFTDKVKLGFGNEVNESTSIAVDEQSTSNLPSQKEKAHYQERLDKLREYMSSKEVKKKDTIKDNSIISSFSQYDNEYNSDNEAIRTGYREFNIPVYCSEQEIEAIIENIEQTYNKEDEYYIYNNWMNNLNLFIENNGNTFLKDVLITVEIPNEDIFIFKDIPSEPSNNFVVDDVPSLYYPEIEEKSDIYSITMDFDYIRHKQSTEFYEDGLKVCFSASAINSIIQIPYKISAKNLENPITGKLKLEIFRR